MIYDMHIHIASLNRSNGSYISDKFKKSLVASHFYKSLGLRKNQVFNLTDEELDKLIIKNFSSLVNESNIDKVMLLGLDAAYDINGNILMDKTKMITSYEFLKEMMLASTKITVAPSIHPYRKDALEELEKLSQEGIKVIKWIPAAQNISPDNDKCIPFYKKLKELNLTLLTHTCIEHAVVSFEQNLNDVARLKLPLSLGVDVIAAHCATNLFIYEKSQYKIWKNMLIEYPNLYGDISAFNVMTRVKYLKDIRQNKILKTRVFYGSDFPMKSLPISFIFDFGITKYLKIKAIKNPIDKSRAIIKEYFGDDEILNNFSNYLLKK